MLTSHVLSPYEWHLAISACPTHSTRTEPTSQEHLQKSHNEAGSLPHFDVRNFKGLSVTCTCTHAPADKNWPKMWHRLSVRVRPQYLYHGATWILSVLLGHQHPHPISHHKVHSIALSLLKHIVLKCIQVVRNCDVTIAIVSTNT